MTPPRPYDGSPTLRVLAAAALALVIAALQRPESGALALAGAAVAATVTRTPLRRLRTPVVLALAIGLAAWGFATIGARTQTSAQALALALKLPAAVLWVAVCLAPLPAAVVGHAARDLGAPPALAQLFPLTLRHASELGATLAIRRAAARARGLSARSLRLQAWLAAGLIGASLDRAQRVHAALRARGYPGPRRARGPLLTPASLSGAVCFVVLAGMLLWWDRR